METLPGHRHGAGDTAPRIPYPRIPVSPYLCIFVSPHPELFPRPQRQHKRVENHVDTVENLETHTFGRKFPSVMDTSGTVTFFPLVPLFVKPRGPPDRFPKNRKTTLAIRL